MRNRILMLGATAALAVAAACGDDESGGINSVALLTNNNFVYYDTSDYYAPASSIEFTLDNFGVAVNAFDVVDSATLDSVLGLSQALIITANYASAFLPDSLSAGQQSVIRDWVDSTGGLLIVFPDAQGTVLLDSLWGYTITQGSTAQHYDLNAASAGGTPFAGGPAEVWDNEELTTADGTTLPGTAQVIYANGTEAAVVVIPQGRGAIVLLAWDWAFAAPHGAQDGNWIEILRRSLKL